MFAPKSILPIATLILLAGSFVAENTFAQYSRSNVLRQAQMRGQSLAQAPANVNSRDPRVAQGSSSRSMPMSPNVTSSPVINSTPLNQSTPIVGGPNANPSYQTLEGPVANMGSPVVHENYIGGEVIDGGFGDDCGGQCGIGNSFFDCSCRTGGCPPGTWENCWIGALGGIFSNAELFAGAHGFRSSNFTAGTQVVDDSSFGFYGGINLGASLCKLTCGLFSGQIGVRSSQSEFEGDFFSTDNRDQLFVTAGIFRRVDYGLQMGIVGDFLHEEWFAETELSQIRGDIGWVYPGGNTIGFRFASGTDDDITEGIINGVAFNNLFAEVVDNYRFYYRMMAANGGYCDAYAGWSDADDAVLGLAMDMPVSGAWGMQAGFNYFLPEDTSPTVPTSTQDSWNVFVGMTLRPQGPLWYGNYDRPLFDVADNGTFVFGRN